MSPSGSSTMLTAQSGQGLNQRRSWRGYCLGLGWSGLMGVEFSPPAELGGCSDDGRGSMPQFPQTPREAG
jgi:hypothetical protein